MAINASWVKAVDYHSGGEESSRANARQKHHSPWPTRIACQCFLLTLHAGKIASAAACHNKACLQVPIRTNATAGSLLSSNNKSPFNWSCKVSFS